MALAPRVGDPDIILDDPRFVVTVEHAHGEDKVVYKATDTDLNRVVAIVVSASRDPEAWHRLAHEASILSRLDHPWILPVYHGGQMVSGAPYLATKLVEGESLEARLKREPESWAALLRHLVDVAEAMTYAHGRGVLHRDLAPSSILIDAQGHTVVLDWSRAREITRTEPETPATAGGRPGYRAPEAREGEVIDPRVDIYSLGAVLYRMAAGRPAHPAVPAGAELERDLAAAPPAIRAIVARACAPDPAARHPLMSALADDLRAALPRPLERSLVPRSRTGKLLGALAMLLVAGAIAFAGVAIFRGDERPRLAARALADVPAWGGSFGVTLLELREGKVRGVYDHDEGVLEGVLDGHVLEIRWCEAPFNTPDDYGRATLAFSADGTDLATFSGSYGYDGDPKKTGPWTLHPAPAAAVTPELQARLSAFVWRCPKGD